MTPRSSGRAEDGGRRAPGTRHRVTLTVNGSEVTREVPTHRRLVALLREDLGLTGTKVACEVGVCGACTVLLDGKAVSACLKLAVQADGAEVTTVEGIAAREEFRPLLDAFVSEGGYQCGFCTSGQIVTAAAVLMSGVEDRPGEADRPGAASPPDRGHRRAYLRGNLCRCTGYAGILRALDRVLG